MFIAPQPNCVRAQEKNTGESLELSKKESLEIGMEKPSEESEAFSINIAQRIIIVRHEIRSQRVK